MESIEQPKTASSPGPNVTLLVLRIGDDRGVSTMIILPSYFDKFVLYSSLIF